jgi:hypothetical protein
MEGTAMNMQIGPARKIGYSFLGLLAGNAAMLVLMLGSMLYPGRWMSLHIAGSNRMLFDTLGMFVVYATFSMLGWVILGLPFVLLLRSEFVSRLLWIFIPSIGAILGPMSLLPIFILLSDGKLTADSFRNSGVILILSALVSTIAFTVYCAFIRQAMRHHRQQA